MTSSCCRLNELTTGASQCSALTLDGLAGVYYSDPSRYSTVNSQAQYDKGLSDAALAHKLPIRIDQQSPSDMLASVQYGARTVARCTNDASPCSGVNASGPWAPRPGPCRKDSRWTQLAGASVLLRAIGVRPFTDVLWTTSIQSDDPRWGIGARRPTVVHDLIVATVTAGPIGFGDLVGHTDAQLLSRALRKDGTILKPASAALRIDRFYRPAPVGGAEIWAAVTGPAGSADSNTDGRSNSMAALGEQDDAMWWWTVLSTGVDGNLQSGADLQIAELWPQPATGTQLLVAILEDSVKQSGSFSLGKTCVNGSLASSCLKLWDKDNALHVANTGPVSQSQKNFTLFAAAPVLDGWTLVGDMTKFVPCSPQRFVAPASAHAPRAKDFDLGSGGLRFIVLGSPNESVMVTVVAPPGISSSPLDGTIIVIKVQVGDSGATEVECATNNCKQVRKSVTQTIKT